MSDPNTMYNSQAGVGPFFTGIDLDGAYLGKSSVDARIVNISADYTLSASDSGKFIVLDSTSTKAITVPRNLPAGFTVIIIQNNVGQASITTAGGATVSNRANFTKTAGRYSAVSLFVVSNVDGVTTKAILTGDGAI